LRVHADVLETIKQAISAGSAVSSYGTIPRIRSEQVDRSTERSSDPSIRRGLDRFCL
jgi:hypothetical protein